LGCAHLHDRLFDVLVYQYTRDENCDRLHNWNVIFDLHLQKVSPSSVRLEIIVLVEVPTIVHELHLGYYLPEPSRQAMGLGFLFRGLEQTKNKRVKCPFQEVPILCNTILLLHPCIIIYYKRATFTVYKRATFTEGPCALIFCKLVQQVIFSDSITIPLI
jgi:hypothetical protein